MSSLKTYTHIEPGGYLSDSDTPPWPVVPLDGSDDLNPTLAPGQWVTHRFYGGYGIIVAIDGSNLTVLWSQEPASDPSFSKFTMPLIRRVFPQTLAPQLISVQPMTMPSGLIFYTDYTYNDKWDARCNRGRWVSRMFWRAFRCTSTRTQRCWSSLRSFLRSLSSTKSTVAALPPRKGRPQHVRHWAPNPTRALASSVGQTRSTEVPTPPEEG
jgi:hypothetical protein